MLHMARHSMTSNSYFSAWCSVFGCENTKKLLCIWHVDRAWRSALNEHITNKQQRVEIYHHHRVLLQERERGKQIYSQVATDNVFLN